MTEKKKSFFKSKFGAIYAKILVGSTGLFGPFFVASFILVPLLGNESGKEKQFAIFAAGFMLALIAYVFQTLLLRRRKGQGPEAYSTYESMSIGYSFKKAWPSYVLALIGGVIGFNGAFNYLTEHMRDFNYEVSPDASGFVAALFVFLIMAVGSVAAFYPSFALVTGRGSFICIILLAIGATLGLMMGVDFGWVSIICISGYIICLIYGSNELALRRISLGTVSGSLSPEIRAVNITLCTILIVATFALFGLLYLVINGIITLVYLLLMLIFSAGTGKESMREPEEIISDINRAVFQTGEPLLSSNFWSIVVTVIVIGFFIFFFIRYKNKSSLSILERLLNLIRRLLDFLLDPIKFFIDYTKARLEEEEFDNYLNFIDESERVKAEPYDVVTKEKFSWHDFMSAYSGKKDSRERFRFSYRVYVSLMRRKYHGLKDSDTPRKTAKELIERAQNAETKERIKATAAEFEKIEFKLGSTDANTEEITDKLVSAIAGELK